jgi:hypothetical protein
MFYVHEVRNLYVPAIFERRRGRLGSKISGCGQLAEVAVYFAMSGLPPVFTRHDFVTTSCRAAISLVVRECRSAGD